MSSRETFDVIGGEIVGAAGIGIEKRLRRISPAADNVLVIVGHDTVDAVAEAEIGGRGAVGGADVGFGIARGAGGPSVQFRSLVQVGDEKLIVARSDVTYIFRFATIGLICSQISDWNRSIVIYGPEHVGPMELPQIGHAATGEGMFATGPENRKSDGGQNENYGHGNQ